MSDQAGMTTKLRVIGAASSAGAYGPGQEQAPAAFRRSGLLPHLSGVGLAVTDAGDVASATFRADAEPPEARDVQTVAAVAGAVADAVAETYAAGERPLVLGGDCTVELGTLAGALRDGSSVGLVYIDHDADLNTPATGDGILDWMGVAHMLGVPGADDRLTAIGGRAPMLPPEAVTLTAVHNITPAEQRVLDELPVRVESLTAVQRSPAETIERIAHWAREYDRLLVHVDADVLDYAVFPIAENTGLRGGLDLDTLTTLLSGLCALPSWSGLTLTEVNPAHAPDEAEAFRRLVDMLVTALGGVTSRHD